MTDICDGAEWTKMDVDDLKAGRSIEQAAQFSAAQIASTTSRANDLQWPSMLYGFDQPSCDIA